MAEKSTASAVSKCLRKYSSPEKARASAWFFKTGPGQYGHGDMFIGASVPDQRRVAKQFADLSLEEVDRLLKSKTHEHRLTGLFILVGQYKAADPKTKKALARFYLSRKSRINNWDLVDSSAPYILGNHLLNANRAVLYTLARSKSLWNRRIAIIATSAFIKEGEYRDTLNIAEILLVDTHDLIHKAVGWMLREVGNKSPLIEEQFLKKYAATMPRTMLRYAIENFPEKKRKMHLNMHREYPSFCGRPCRRFSSSKAKNGETLFEKITNMNSGANSVETYVNAIYEKTKDPRLIGAGPKIGDLVSKAVKITGLMDVSTLLSRIDLKPRDLTIEALEGFLGELRAIFWLRDFGFTGISPIQASNKKQPDFSAKYKGKTCAIEVFCLTQEHEQQKNTMGVYANFDPSFVGSKFGRDFMSKAPEKKQQLDTYVSDLKVLLCVVNSNPIIRLNTKKELYGHLKLLYAQLGWTKPYYLGVLTGVGSDTIFPQLK